MMNSSIQIQLKKDNHPAIYPKSIDVKSCSVDLPQKERVINAGQPAMRLALVDPGANLTMEKDGICHQKSVLAMLDGKLGRQVQKSRIQCWERREPSLRGRRLPKEFGWATERMGWAVPSLEMLVFGSSIFCRYEHCLLAIFRPREHIVEGFRLLVLEELFFSH
jgi:hypothetical protein